jgi:hypothetical protein
MSRINVGMQQADRDRLGLMGVDLLQKSRQRMFVERDLNRSVSTKTLVDAEASIAWDQGRRWFRLKPINVAADMAVDLEHVLETFGGQQQAFGELAFEHRIGGDRRPMHQKPDVGQYEIEAIGGLAQALHQSARRIGECGGDFPAMDFIGSSVEDM